MWSVGRVVRNGRNEGGAYWKGVGGPEGVMVGGLAMLDELAEDFVPRLPAARAISPMHDTRCVRGEPACHTAEEDSPTDKIGNESIHSRDCSFLTQGKSGIFHSQSR